MLDTSEPEYGCPFRLSTFVHSIMFELQEDVWHSIILVISTELLKLWNPAKQDSIPVCLLQHRMECLGHLCLMGEQRPLC